MKSPHPTDKHVGARVRMRRMQLGFSQMKLGKDLGLTFQQVQKYETGKNRIGASRLLQTAHVLQVPVSYFYEGLAGHNGASQPVVAGGDPLITLGTTRDGLALAVAFNAITNPNVRRAIVAMVEASAPTSTVKSRAA
jgi:transcriptional regulator with XRE-family HTH domain